MRSVRRASGLVQTPQWLPTGVQPALEKSRADGYAEEHRQRWNGAAGHARVAAARCAIGCSSHSPIDSGSRASSRSAARRWLRDGRHDGGDRAADGNHGAMRRPRQLGTDAICGARGPVRAAAKPKWRRPGDGHERVVPPDRARRSFAARRRRVRRAAGSRVPRPNPAKNHHAESTRSGRSFPANG
jgi:hypothetical protein